MAWYQNEYKFAKQNILFRDKNKTIIIQDVDNQLLNKDKQEGLFILDFLFKKYVKVKHVLGLSQNTSKNHPLSLRSPYERVFAHCNKKVRYRGLEKVQFQVGIRALTFNLKRALALGVQKIECLPVLRINPSAI